MAGLYRGKVQDGCEINYMQSKKYPNSSEKVYPNNNVSNKGLLKNPYNNISEPIAKPGQRPLRITTDMWGNVYARSDTMLVPGVTNSNLLKNPFNNLSEPVPEKKVLSNQKIKDINNKNIPEFMRKNVGVTDLAMKMLMMIRNKNVKLFTIRLMSYLVTKNLNDIQIELGARGEQQILQAVNIYNQLMANAKRISVEYGSNEEQLTTNLYPYVHSYVEQLIRLVPALGDAELPDIDSRITKALADLAAVSSALNRLFDQDKAPEPSSILSAADIVRLGGIQAASVPPVVAPVGGGGGGPTPFATPPQTNRGSPPPPQANKRSPSTAVQAPRQLSVVEKFANFMLKSENSKRLLENRDFRPDVDRNDNDLFEKFLKNNRIVSGGLDYQDLLRNLPSLNAIFRAQFTSFMQEPTLFNPVYMPNNPVPTLPTQWKQQQLIEGPVNPQAPPVLLSDVEPLDNQDFIEKWIKKYETLSDIEKENNKKAFHFILL